VRIAVAIPEGPLLPLAILVVHALNYPIDKEPSDAASGHDSPQQYGVLVPIEPSEAKERNLHILKDARPALILSVPGKDMDRMHELTDLIRSRRTDDDDNNESVSIASQSVVLDFVAMAKKAKRSIEMLGGDRIESAFTALEIKMQSMSLLEVVVNLSTKLFDSTRQYMTNLSLSTQPRVSHIVYTSGTTGRPKGCVASIASLQHYLSAKNKAHDISTDSTILLASSLSFDPCLSDILATFHARATLAIAPRRVVLSDIASVLQRLNITHVLCTPTLWSLVPLPGQASVTSMNVENYFPHLQRVALGGEPISRRLVQVWARSSLDDHECCRLLATYGVTEACVYQTCGEVFCENSLTSKGQCVGLPLEGTRIRICKEEVQDRLLDIDMHGEVGEVVLCGKQVDALTGYLHRPELDHKFVAEQRDAGEIAHYHYRTGDRGVIDPMTGSLTIMGRIVGEEGMIKINGVRVELGEIEAAILDNTEEENPRSRSGSMPFPSIVLDCLAVVHAEEDTPSSIHVYVVLSDAVCQELGISEWNTDCFGLVIAGGPIWTLLRTRCTNRLKASCIPSAFVVISHLPLSPTGKRDRSQLPKLELCQLLTNSQQETVPLRDYGCCGEIVTATITEVLNLQPCQQQLLTKSASFAMMGGDSLSATLIARTLYAHHMQVENSRFLGGDRGQLPEPFTVVNLIQSKTLGDYVDLLDKQGVCISTSVAPREVIDTEQENSEEMAADRQEEVLYEALLQAATLDQSVVAVGLLQIGADPNFGDHGGRIGKTSGRLQQRAIFKANPLHLACTKGDQRMVHALLQFDVNFKSPNTNGLYPIHLAAGTLLGNTPNPEEESICRLECVKMLLDAGCPLLMRDANKQSILHAAARAGHTAIIEFCIDEYYSEFEREGAKNSASMPPSHFINWHDRWFRTPVHWATLNGRVQTLRVLLEKGCSPAPTQPNTNKYTSMANETPLEICQRLHGGTAIGSEMEHLLTKAIVE
jgi:acyl-CoA synthetase (AMP-forming)/AMP-acid ligase II/ankyrin repeat protein